MSYRGLLEFFFVFHDPTTLNRQGPDVGTQYRPAIFTHSALQESTADAVIAGLTAARVFDRPIVTEVVPAPAFYPAEPYHQQYFQRNPSQAYCQAMIAPKVAKLRAALGPAQGLIPTLPISSSDLHHQITPTPPA